MTDHCPCLPLKRWQLPDQDLWLAAKAPTRGVVRRHARFAHRSAAYWKILEEAYGAFLGWLQASAQLDWTTEPTHRCCNKRLQAYVKFMLAEGQVTPGTAEHRVAHLRVALKAIGELPDKRMFTHVCRHLRRLARRARRFERAPSSTRLKALGLKLMQLAESGLDPRPRVNAVLFRDGLMIALLAHRPLRRRNCAELRIHYDLLRIGEDWWIVLENHQAKNRKAVEMRWPADLVPALERYLAVYRPLLTGVSKCPTNALWVTYRGRPEAARTLSGAVAIRTEAEFGRSWRPHAFRRSAADAATVADAATLLGDTPSVVEKNYAPTARRAALQTHMKMLQGFRG